MIHRLHRCNKPISNHEIEPELDIALLVMRCYPPEAHGHYIGPLNQRSGLMARRATASRQHKGSENSTSPGEFDTAFARIQAAIPGITSQCELAEALGIKQSSVSDAKKRQVIPGEWAIKLFRSHRINPHWIYEGLEPARISGLDEASGEESIPARESFLLRYNLRKVMVVRVEDASMEPIISRNAYVGINAEDQLLVSNALYAFALPPEGVTLRRIVLKAGGKRIEMRAEQPSVPRVNMPLNTAQRHVLGKVAWVMQAPGPGMRPGNTEDKKPKFE